MDLDVALTLAAILFSPNPLESNLKIKNLKFVLYSVKCCRKDLYTYNFLVKVLWDAWMNW